MKRATVSHWLDYGELHPEWGCHATDEHCRICGRLMVETVEPTGRFSRHGEPTHAVWHSCPTWTEGWRTRNRLFRAVFLPGYGHDSHDAENPLTARGYR